MSDLITGQLPNLTKINSVKQLTHSVCFNHWSITKFTQNKLIKIANTECLL